MSIDGSKNPSIDEDMVVYRSMPDNFSPCVTIGMPTFNRAHTIRRALASIGKQTYRDFVLVISDNAGRDEATLEAVKEFAPNLPGVLLVAQSENKGALNNLSYLLSAAGTEYFMWLADDDEISETYLEDLVGLLDADHDAVAAMGRWHSMTSPAQGHIRRQSHHTAKNLYVRAMKYVAGPTDDSFFYGLHRTSSMQRCTFDDYLFPNKGVLTNCCYTFLFGQIVQGTILHAATCEWKCHNYSEKQYVAAKALGFRDRLKTLLRRINVYGLYCVKAFKKNPLLLPPVFIASVYGLLRDVLTAAGRISYRAISKRVCTGSAN